MSAAPEETVKVTTLAALKAPPAPETQLPEVAAGFGSMRAFELLQRAGKALAAASLIPDNYRNNLPNCIIALELAMRIGASPLLVMQNLYIVYGRPAWSAKFLIACFNQCGRFSAVRYLWSGTRGKDDWGCQAWAIERETGEKIFGPVITLQLAKDEGWYGRKDSKWKTMPEKMFMYRAAAWMIDTHAPELSMGIRTEEEIRDTFDATRGADGSYAVTTESLRQANEVIEQVASSEVPANVDPQTGEVTQTEIESAISILRAATTIKALDAAWKDISHDFTGKKMPVEIEAARNEKREQLQQQL